MQATHTLTVESREKTGSRYAKRAYAQGKLPCVLYGQERDPRHLQLDRKEALRFFESGERVFTIALGDVTQHVLLKALQYDYLGDNVIHCDLMRVNLDDEVESNVPLHFKGDAKGLKTAGSILNQQITELAVTCKVSAIPEEIVHDISDLEVGHPLHAREIALPKGVVLAGDPEAIIAIISVIKGEDEATDAEAEAGAE